MRHAEPALTGVLLGQCDPPLSAYGREQAARLTLPSGVVWTSGLRRATETAQGIVVPGLNEISYGEWDGLSWSEIERRWPDLARHKLENWMEITPPGGELWADFAARVRAALKPLENVSTVIVAHEAVNAIIAARLTGENPNQFRQAYCEIKSYDY
ncbi:MAG: histidine phosphatase family protein [Bryobacteraceae bacterium]